MGQAKWVTVVFVSKYMRCCSGWPGHQPGDLTHSKCSSLLHWRITSLGGEQPGWFHNSSRKRKILQALYRLGQTDRGSCYSCQWRLSRGPHPCNTTCNRISAKV